MPELPEVETIRLGLERHFVGRILSDITLWGHRIIRTYEGNADDFRRSIRGRHIDATGRRGKFLWAILDSDTALLFHLGMSGQLHSWSPRSCPRQRVAHEYARMECDDQSVLSFIDQRTFGRLEATGLTDEGIPDTIEHIARDPLDKAIDLDEVNRKIRRSASPIKTLLLNQGLISGIGNIYADEALFAAGVHGARRGRSLRRWEVTNVLEAATQVMRAAIAVGGTSFDALYVDVEGNPGYFERSLRVYGRDNQACTECGSQITRLMLQGRSHYFCATCQPRSGPSPVRNIE
ncbi:MAG: bifunctional DNA-formamidopyrimidine glycosylase/DNA-(apurinic or apyrimidinic site) lyase [Actinomycetaceae bacterium]|nr:bifunctional DNA-formamidopyrimidine glycosylase/DNA-(apurinic or apyrimidinic site) lyase [Actinomycetaceae bacterium]